MTDQQTIASAIAAFRRCSNHLGNAERQLLALLALCIDQVESQLHRLECLPFAARFSPFSVLTPAGTQSPASRPKHGATTKKGDFRAKSGTALIEPAIASAGATAAVPVQRDRGWLGPVSTRQDETTAAGNTATATFPFPASSLPSAQDSSVHKTEDASASSAIPLFPDRPTTAQLVEAALQRHAAPPANSPLHGIKPQSAPSLRINKNVQSNDSSKLTDRMQAKVASAAKTSSPAKPATSSTAGTPGRSSSRDPGDETKLASKLVRNAIGVAAMPSRVSPFGATQPRHGNDLLHYLLPTDGSRIPSAASARENVNAPARGKPSSSSSAPQQRAPSRLLSGTGANVLPTHAALEESARPKTTPSMPADNASLIAADEMASRLERLLREQAWLRGVDLT